jgi:hypothetical protein
MLYNEMQIGKTYKAGPTGRFSYMGVFEGDPRNMFGISLEKRDKRRGTWTFFTYSNITECSEEETLWCAECIKQDKWLPFESITLTKDNYQIF